MQGIKASGLNIAFLAYRSWAFPVFESIRKHPKVSNVDLYGHSFYYASELVNRLKTSKSYDLVMYCGWSDEPDEEMIKLVPHIGLHCAETDVYSLGTPLQNQIIDGLTRTKHRIFKVGYPELSLRLWSHEVDLDLSGNICDVFEQMTATSKSLYNAFLDDWPNIVWKEWPEVPIEEMREKRRPEHSAIRVTQVANMTTRQLYNFFRCLEDPYPNGYIEDEHGRLYVGSVRYEEK